MWIIGYGSLMNKNQFYKENNKLVLVKGWKRIFNRIDNKGRWASKINDKEVAVLNIQKSNSFFNAIAYKINDKDLDLLKEREINYYLEEVEMLDFTTRKNLGNGFIFVSNEKNGNQKIVRDDILPAPRYLKVCLEGAYSWGEDFGKMFEKTTYLANGELV